MKKIAIRVANIISILMIVVLISGLIGTSLAAAETSDTGKWSFGVMSDTQWIGNDDGKNPNSVAVGIIKQLNQQFIKQGVKFVVQVGDLTDNGSNLALDTTAVFRQDLYNSDIGFYPLRGNHESSKAGALEFLRMFPQTQTGVMNNTPVDAYNVSNSDASTQPFPAKSGSTFQIGSISANPAAPVDFTGLCYAFDYNNARFVLLDQFTPISGASHSTLDASQIDWMNAQLSSRPDGTHAFVFGHKGIITENHVDTLFGNDPSVSPALQNTFINDLNSKGVRYYMGGHDHMYNRALVTSVNGTAGVQDITLASDSSKFYIPFGTAGYTRRNVDSITKKVTSSGVLASTDPTQTNDYIYDVQVGGGTARETPISQELNTIGYYIYTVEGPKVTCDYYSAVVNPTLSNGEYLISVTPTLNFTKQETFGYSLNGKEFMVPEGAQYTGIADQFGTTSARILAGANNNTVTDSSGRTLTKDIDTGWTAKNNDNLNSDIFTLWGMADNLGSNQTDTYVLSMSYDNGHTLHLGNGGFGIATQDDKGSWVNAVAMNYGGTANFVIGPWNSSYTLGTYGIDPGSKTAWAVINYNSTFAVSNGIEPVPGQRK